MAWLRSPVHRAKTLDVLSAPFSGRDAGLLAGVQPPEQAQRLAPAKPFDSPQRFVLRQQRSASPPRFHIAAQRSVPGWSMLRRIQEHPARAPRRAVERPTQRDNGPDGEFWRGPRASSRDQATRRQGNHSSLKQGKGWTTRGSKLIVPGPHRITISEQAFSRGACFPWPERAESMTLPTFSLLSLIVAMATLVRGQPPRSAQQTKKGRLGGLFGPGTEKPPATRTKHPRTNPDTPAPTKVAKKVRAVGALSDVMPKFPAAPRLPTAVAATSCCNTQQGRIRDGKPLASDQTKTHKPR